MVYCRYCGTQNRDGTLKCINCGKPLSLIPNDSHPNSMQDSSRNHYSKKDDYRKNNNYGKIDNYGNNRNNHNDSINSDVSNYHRGPIKDSYMRKNQELDNFENPSKYPVNLNKNQNNDYYSKNYGKKPVKSSKNSVEWDVVIATALMVIILTAILQRIFPFMAIFISLIIGLIYILIATKSKSSLFKAIPLTVITILAISAYFSI